MPKLSYYFSVLLFLCVACKEKTATQQTEQKPIKSLQIRYAKGFSIDYYENYKLVSVLQSGFATKDTLKYILVEREKMKLADFAKNITTNLPKNAIIVEIPLQSIVCLSTTHAPLLAEINEVDKIVGFSDIQYSAVSQLQEQAKNGKTKEVGNANGVVNTELLLSLQANALMTYSEKDYHRFTKLGQKVLINTEYLETLPLGRAEWILFAAAFFNKETAAQNFFDKVEKNYQEIKKLAVTTTDKKPSVFGTIPYSNIWYMPAGESFAANLWLDAGCEYAWKDAKGTGSLQLSVEEVVQKAQNADIWLNVGAINSIKELLATDNRFAVFEAVKNKQIYNSNKRITAGGGHEYYEYGVIRPDLVLQDLVIILHPKLLPNKELYFYNKLE